MNDLFVDIRKLEMCDELLWRIETLQQMEIDKLKIEISIDGFRFYSVKQIKREYDSFEFKILNEDKVVLKIKQCEEVFIRLSYIKQSLNITKCMNCKDTIKQGEYINMDIVENVLNYLMILKDLKTQQV